MINDSLPTNKPLRYTILAYYTCPKCNGTGKHPKELGISKELDCFPCNGKGEVSSEVNLVDALAALDVVRIQLE